MTSVRDGGDGATYSPASEGLLLGIGNLGGEISHRHWDVRWGGGSQLHLDRRQLFISSTRGNRINSQRNIALMSLTGDCKLGNKNGTRLQRR